MVAADYDISERSKQRHYFMWIGAVVHEIP